MLHYVMVFMSTCIMVMWILHNGLEGIRSLYLPMLGCRVKPEAVSRLYWNKGPSEAELSIGPNLVKLVAKGLSLCSLFHPDLRLHQIKRKLALFFKLGTRGSIKLED
jgi:hypothetical protein